MYSKVKWYIRPNLVLPFIYILLIVWNLMKLTFVNLLTPTSDEIFRFRFVSGKKTYVTRNGYTARCTSLARRWIEQPLQGKSKVNTVVNLIEIEPQFNVWLYYVYQDNNFTKVDIKFCYVWNANHSERQVGWNQQVLFWNLLLNCRRFGCSDFTCHLSSDLY